MNVRVCVYSMLMQLCYILTLTLNLRPIVYLLCLHRFLTRKDFLERCDVRTYEVEKVDRTITKGGGVPGGSANNGAKA